MQDPRTKKGPKARSTDNRADQLVGESEMSADRAKHLLRKHLVLQQREYFDMAEEYTTNP